MKLVYRTTFSTLIIFGMACGSAAADSFTGIHPLQTDRFSFSLGSFFSEIDGDFYKDASKVDVSVDVDMQDDMGMDSEKTLPAASFNWRLANKHRIQAEYFTVGQNGGRTLSRGFDWGDLEFEAGVDITSEFDMTILRGFYGYSFFKDAKKEFGAGLGLHYLDMAISIQGEAYLTVEGEENSREWVASAERGIDEWVILPNIGVYGNYAFSPKWLAIGRIDWLSVNIDDYKGGLWNVEAAVQYQAFKHFGIGLAYRYVAFNIEADEEDGGWGANLDYTGPLLFLTTNF